MEVFEADRLADHTVHADVAVERSRLGTHIGGDGNDMSIAVGVQDTVFASTDATSALDAVEVGHLDVHEDKVEDLGAKQLERL